MPHTTASTPVRSRVYRRRMNDSAPPKVGSMLPPFSGPRNALSLVSGLFVSAIVLKPLLHLSSPRKRGTSIREVAELLAMTGRLGLLAQRLLGPRVRGDDT